VYNKSTGTFPTLRRNGFAPEDGPNVEDCAPVLEYPLANALVVSDDDDAASSNDDDTMPELSVDGIWKHEFNDIHTRMLYRVRGFPGRHSAHDLEQNFVGVHEAVYRY
jgi:hypothetical protein